LADHDNSPRLYQLNREKSGGLFEDCACGILKLQRSEPVDKNVDLLFDPYGDLAAIIFQVPFARRLMSIPPVACAAEITC
jgi:hypothetical protein